MAWPDFTYDLYEDFEDALGASWSETDADNNLNPADATAKYNGAQGMSVNYRGDTAGANISNILYNSGGERTAASIGFWFRGPSIGSNADVVIAGVSIATDTNNVRIYYTRVTGPVYRLRLRGTGFSANVKTVQPNTWYWVTLNYVKNDTCTLRVYGTDTVEIDAATSVTCTANNNVCNYFAFGARGGATDEDIENWFDDIVIDWTDSTFPLLGWETAAGGGQGAIKRFGGVPHMALNSGVW